jgi:UDP-N-acetylmuramoylalanine--D-glutamate ligase
LDGTEDCHAVLYHRRHDDDHQSCDVQGAVIDVRGKIFSIIGAARSGRSVAKLLSRHGAETFVSDAGAPENMGEARKALEALGVPYEFGEHSARVLDADTIVLSPGVPSNAPIVKLAEVRGIRVVSEIEVASWFCSAPMLAITGTNGKTTATTLTGRIFSDAKVRSSVGGNIGTAFSEIVEGLTQDSVAILEISSFQLDYIDQFRPKVSVMLNITPDHLDRYEHSFELYTASKMRIFRNQAEGDIVIYNSDDDVTRSHVQALNNSGVRRLPFSITQTLSEGAWVDAGSVILHTSDHDTKLIPVNEISIPGEHNLYNAMAAGLAAQAMGVPTASIRATLRNFKGVEHRLEFVADIDGVQFINDSKATNVDAVWYALRSFQSRIVLLLGGRDKGNDYTTLDPQVKNRVRAIVAIGESAGTVSAHFTGIVPVHTAGSMAEAVRTAARVALSGDVVLLSPACASFDWFRNYEERGRVFKDEVMKLQQTAP